MQYLIMSVKTTLSVFYILALDLYSLVRGVAFGLGRQSSAEVDAEQVQQLREKGYLLLENYYSSEQVDGILAMAEAHMREECGDFDHINGQSYYRRPEDDQMVDGGVYRLFAADALQDDVRAFRGDRHLVQLFEAAFRTRIVCHATVLQKNLPQGSETRGFHVDMYAPKQFKAFLFLSDVLEEGQGPYAVIEGSHRWRWRHCLNFLRRGLSGNSDVTSFTDLQRADMDRLHLFKVRRGTVVLATQQAIHRGWPLAQGARYALINYYVEQLPSYVPAYRVNNRLGYRYAPSLAEEAV